MEEECKVVTEDGGYRRFLLEVNPAIAAEIRSHDLAKSRGAVRVDPVEGQLYLVRLRLAALLALLDDRLEVDEEDWRLAGMAIGTNRAVIGPVRGELHPGEKA